MSIRGQSVIVAMRAMTGLFSLSTTGRALMLLKVSVADRTVHTYCFTRLALTGLAHVGTTDNFTPTPPDRPPRKDGSHDCTIPLLRSRAETAQSRVSHTSSICLHS
jgi:hypothetical protein